MCGSGQFIVGDQTHWVYMGYYGGSFDDHQVQPNIKKQTEDEAKEQQAVVRGLLGQYSKEELIEGFLNMLLTAAE